MYRTRKTNRTPRALIVLVSIFAAGSLLPLGFQDPLAAAQGERSRVQRGTPAQDQRGDASLDQRRRDRFPPPVPGVFIDDEGGVNTSTEISEALTGFDAQTNGFLEQGPSFDSIAEETVVIGTYNDNRFIFEEVEDEDDGLGPTYNAQSCRECHQNVVTGGASQVTEHRAGRLVGGEFFESQGGSLIHSRATGPEIMELVSVDDDIHTFRISTNTLGLGYVEAISNGTLEHIRNEQPPQMRGVLTIVPVLEAEGRMRYGRMGHKSQHASAESFSADAYLNEMGITSPLLPDENTSSGNDVGDYDPVPDPEDDGEDVVAFADFMRSTKAPPRGPITDAVLTGEAVFTDIGCATCHVATIVTAAPETPINGGVFTVHPSLGNKVIHPYSDFQLHNVGTGDDIPIQPTPEYTETADKIRTAPLWGLRIRNRLMHDGLTFTREGAILRHAGQATPVTRAYMKLRETDKANLIAFLNSL